jgi:hypothetical protein
MDNESERVRLKKKLLELQYQKQLLNEERQKLVEEGKSLEEYEKYFQRIQWTNYGEELVTQHKLEKQIWTNQNQQIDAKLEEIKHQIKKVRLDISCLKSLEVPQEPEVKQLIDDKYEPASKIVTSLLLPQEKHEKVTNGKSSKQRKELEPFCADALNIPKRILHLIGENEELKGWLVDLRIEWYQNIPLFEIRSLIHVRVWVKTWFTCFELGIKSMWNKIVYRFRPLYKPRLPR